MNKLVVHKGRTNVVPVSLGYDVSSDTITSEIRTHKAPDADLIATWSVTFLTDGTDGELLLTLDDSVTEDIDETNGYMDIKRVTSGEPLPVFDSPIEVVFETVVTE